MLTLHQGYMNPISTRDSPFPSPIFKAEIKYKQARVHTLREIPKHVFDFWLITDLSTSQLNVSLGLYSDLEFFLFSYCQEKKNHHFRQKGNKKLKNHTDPKQTLTGRWVTRKTIKKIKTPKTSKKTFLLASPKEGTCNCTKRLQKKICNCFWQKFGLFQSGPQASLQSWTKI